MDRQWRVLIYSETIFIKTFAFMSHPLELLIGAHTSGAGGLQNALLEAQSIGATTCQLFTANQKRWESAPLTKKVIEDFRATLQETGLKKIMCHDSYLINLGAAKEEVLGKSREAFRREIERCQLLGISYLNFHPGAFVGDTEDACFEKIKESLLGVQDLLATDGKLRLLIESTAGQGTTVGHRFEHLARMISDVKHAVPIGVCIDTCHIFAAGYDLRTQASFHDVIDEFDRVVGLQHLHAFHVNDSIHDLGSRKDRHAPLGEGKIGLEGFFALMTHPHLTHLPKYLETPGGPPLWEKEIQMLRKFAQGIYS